MIDAADLIAIHQIISLYGHIIDDRQFSRLQDVFTHDVRYDTTDFGGGVDIGADAVRRLWLDPATDHPLAHHATNVYVFEAPDGTVRVRSKGIGVGFKGRVGSVLYDDIVRKEVAGWRIAERVCRLRRASSIPDPS